MSESGNTSAEHLLAFPGIQRVPSNKLELIMLRRFLSPLECHGLIELIDINRRPSTIADPNGDDYFRTSETCDLDHRHPLVVALDAKLAWLSGIDPAHSEPLQGQRYEVDQEFKAHTDYFEPGGTDYEQYCSVSGQRTWTFMIFLNEVAAGGGTRFREIDKIIQPETGKLLDWNSRLPGGGVNGATLHRAMKVRKGLKYVVTRWYRERPWGWSR